jgi:hypothetical protein
MAQPETVNRSRVNRRLFREQRKTVELTAVESLILFGIYRLAISSIRSIVVVRLF